MWNELGLSIVCDIYKRYSTHYSIRLLAYIDHNQIKYSNAFKKIPTIGAIQCVLRRCSQLAKTPKGISQKHYRVWNQTFTPSYPHIPVFTWYFMIKGSHQSIHVRVLGPVHVSGAPIDVYSQTVGSYFSVLPYIMNKKQTEYSARTGNASYKRLASVDEINADGTPRVIEIFTFRILQDPSPIITITDLQKTYQYDSLSTYCSFYMDGFDVAARRKCKYMEGHVYNDFMSYYDSVKDRIEANDVSEKKQLPLTTDEIMKWAEALDARHLLKYYNPIIEADKLKWIDMRDF